jgi:quercetin 2,3-dioxygenase
MSGPVRDEDHSPEESFDQVEVRDGRRAMVGSLDVVRVLPTKGRRTVGAWCFVDLMLPGDEVEPDPMEIGPHPHIGLQTATWLFRGEAVHSDSLGTEQVIRPGQLNLMTAGNGIAHAELSSEGGVFGLQMWIAQPEQTRHGASAFEHHGALPTHELDDGEARVVIGSLEGTSSPARTDTRLVGAELHLGKGAAVINADPSFEYGLVPVEGTVKINGAIVEPGSLALVPPGGRTLHVEASHAGAAAMLIGGEPLGEPIQMWWNFVARTRDELTEAWSDWAAGDTDRFPEFRSPLGRIEAPVPAWARG